MDRHSFSEPRPVETSPPDLPTWQVDVLREGVPDPVFTLEINKKTLPPRMRKKRVVWKLPDSLQETPNFGSDERKRMLELWKQQKKSRKKLTKRNSSVGSTTNESTNGDGNGDTIPKQDQSEPEFYEVQPSEIPLQTNGHHHPPGFGDTPGFEASNGRRHDNTVTSHELSDANGHSSHSLDPPPSTPTIPPPGFANLSLNEEEQQESSLSDPQPTPTTTESPAITNDTLSSSPPSSLPQHYFTVPSHSTNIPVDLAKIVVDSYYPFLTHGHAELVAQYYCNDAQKSLSVGGAHAVCHSHDDFLPQLQSLTGFQFLVKGVVAQPGVKESVVLLITGSVQTTSMQVLPYCHSLTLIRVTSDANFQIHNDAMALLTE